MAVKSFLNTEQENELHVFMLAVPVLYLASCSSIKNKALFIYFIITLKISILGE